MRILAIDTTSEVGGAAIVSDGECLASIAHSGEANKYSVSLFEMVEKLLAESSARPGSEVHSLADIELYAVAGGPGSFTGIRVGLAAVQAWARVFGKPAVRVSVLEALTAAANPSTQHALAILNAYRGEFYVGGFHLSGDGAVVPSAEGRVLRLEEIELLAATLGEDGRDCTCIVRAHDKAAQSLREKLPGELCWKVVEGTLLESIARLGRNAALERRLDTISQLDAYYIRRTDAELNWKK